LQTLPWLPRPSGKMRDRIASLPLEPLEALLFLQSLAQTAWGEADLRLLGRKIRTILEAAPSGFATEARLHGLTQIRILVLSASTASHISDALIGTAIRFKFLLDVTIAEYEEPEPWLARNRRELKENPPNFVLVASDNRMLKPHHRSATKLRRSKSSRRRSPGLRESQRWLARRRAARLFCRRWPAIPMTFSLTWTLGCRAARVS
jgi:hypothetical protein